MTNLPAPENALGYLTPLAYDVAHQKDIIGIEPFPEAIEEIGRIAAEVDSRFALPTAATGLAIVLRGGSNTAKPHMWDGRFRDAGSAQNYIPFGELAYPQPMPGSMLTKTQIMGLERPVLELSTEAFDMPLGVRLVGTLTGAFPHRNRAWSAAATLISGDSPVLNAKRLLAMEQVRRRKLEPFIIHRPPGSSQRIELPS